MTTPVASAAPPARYADEFLYGLRYVQRAGTNGEVVFDEVPLTLEDVLHPLEGDVIPEHPFHGEDRDYLRRACHSRVLDDSGVVVLSDCLIDWGNAGIRPLSPDVSIIFDVPDSYRPSGMFWTAREGTRPRLVLEIVSPHTRSNDVEKIALYHQLGIPDYVIIDQHRENGPRSLVHYRWEPAGYVEVPGSANGVLLACVNVSLCVCATIAPFALMPPPARKSSSTTNCKRRSRPPSAKFGNKTAPSKMPNGVCAIWKPNCAACAMRRLHDGKGHKPESRARN